MTLFVAPPHPMVTDTVRGLVRGWQEKWWVGIDDGLTRGALADALQEAGHEYDYRIRALQELPCWSPGMYPMTPEIASI